MAAATAEGAPEPWDEQAVRRWEKGAAEDVFDAHHLAVAHHARAYDLEADGDAAAFGHFRKALSHWARLYAEPEFWRRLRLRLAEVMEVPVDTGTVEAVRARLPAEVLDPHLTLAGRYRRTDPARARAHMRLVADSEFPAEIVAAVRHALVHEVLDGVPQAVSEGRFEETVTALESWLAVDGDNVELLRALLLSGRHWAEHLYLEPGARHRMDQVLARVEGPLRQVVERIGTATGELARELARHEFLMVFHIVGNLHGSGPVADLATLDGIRRSRHEADRAAAGIERALTLDPELPDDPTYGEANNIRDTQVPLLQAQFAALEARLLLTAPGVDDEDLAEATRLVGVAEGYQVRDPDLESVLASVHYLIELRGPDDDEDW